MASTKLDICNQALGLLKVDPVLDLDLTDGTGTAAQKCNLFFDSTKAEVLRAHKWNRAYKDQQLIQDTISPLSKFSYRYRLPADYIRVWDLNSTIYPGSDPQLFWEIRGSDDGIWFHTDETTALIGYVFDQEIGRLDSLCTMGMYYLLAAKMAFSLLGTESREAQLLQYYEGFIKSLAASSDSIEASEKQKNPRRRSRWHKARYRGTSGTN